MSRAGSRQATFTQDSSPRNPSCCNSCGVQFSIVLFKYARLFLKNVMLRWDHMSVHAFPSSLTVMVLFQVCWFYRHTEPTFAACRVNSVQRETFLKVFLSPCNDFLDRIKHVLMLRCLRMWRAWASNIDFQPCPLHTAILVILCTIDNEIHYSKIIPQ